MSLAIKNLSCKVKIFFFKILGTFIYVDQTFALHQSEALAWIIHHRVIDGTIQTKGQRWLKAAG